MEFNVKKDWFPAWSYMITNTISFKKICSVMVFGLEQTLKPNDFILHSKCMISNGLEDNYVGLSCLLSIFLTLFSFLCYWLMFLHFREI